MKPTESLLLTYRRKAVEYVSSVIYSSFSTLLCFRKTIYIVAEITAFNQFDSIFPGAMPAL